MIAEKHTLSPNWKDRHKIHVKHETSQLYDALQEAIDILKERRVDRMIRDRQEQLRTADDATMMLLLAEIKAYNEVKQKLSKRTGRVVVG
ncbi:MAG: hypothetical protein IPJ85_06140 [Flavobacteriales bacterium]|nr:hypothetical protein [Flavobacteriales bacterium]